MTTDDFERAKPIIKRVDELKGQIDYLDSAHFKLIDTETNTAIADRKELSLLNAPKYIKFMNEFWRKGRPAEKAKIKIYEYGSTLSSLTVDATPNLIEVIKNEMEKELGEQEKLLAEIGTK